MIFEFKNLGSIKEAQIEMGNLTVICGKNNTGKTYLTYAVWGFIKNWQEGIQFASKNIETDIENGKDLEIDLLAEFEIFKQHLQKINDTYCKNIHNVFSSNSELFKDTSLIITYLENYKNIILNKEIKVGLLALGNMTKEKGSYILKIHPDKPTISDAIGINNLIGSSIYDSFFMPYKIYSTVLFTAQRDSIQLFQKSLDKHNTNLIIKLRETQNIDLLNKYSARFSQPINENIDFARYLASHTIKQSSFLQKQNPELLTEIETILGVNFIVGNDSVSIKDNKTETIIPDYMASTSVRSLLYLHFWLKHQAQKGDLLMIDEPELNLHPENQIKMARLFAKLVNVGIKVWITTHSDYIVKELNNLVMLGNVSDREEMLSRFKNEKGENEYSENDILKAEDLKAYIAYNLPDGSGATVRKIDVDKYGMVESTFDETIDKMNEVAGTFAGNIKEENYSTNEYSKSN